MLTRSHRLALFVAVTAAFSLSLNPGLRAETPTYSEHVHGSGRITTASGTLARVGFMAFFDADTQTFRGAFHFSDRDSDIQVTATGLIDYGVVSPESRILSYSLDSATGYDEARVVLTDTGKSGALDSVVVQLLLNGNILYETPANLVSGNVGIQSKRRL